MSKVDTIISSDTFVCTKSVNLSNTFLCMRVNNKSKNLYLNRQIVCAVTILHLVQSESFCDFKEGFLMYSI
jgi:hypothetical protein